MTNAFGEFDAMRLLGDLVNERNLIVASTSWQDPVLILSGDRWRLRIMTAWRIIFEGRFVFSSDDKIGASELSTILDGNQIIAYANQSTSCNLDPALRFTSGHILEVFSMSAIEPWILFLDGVGAVVASPSKKPS